MSHRIVLATLNARYMHASLGLRYLLANMQRHGGQAVADCAVLREFTIHECRDLRFHHHLLSFAWSSSGFRRSAIASRARKIRERTVPTGQSISCAISS